MPAPAELLLVSKPLRPPWNDGSTVLVRALAEGMDPAWRLVYFGDPAAPLRANGEVLPAAPMGHAPSLAAKARVLAALLSPRRRHLPLHLFFTPNRVTSSVVALLRRLQPARPMVQSLMSADGIERWAPLLRPLDAVVVLSETTRARLVAAGLPPGRVRRIYPGVAPGPLADPAVIAARRRLLYAGDLDPAVGRRLQAIARALDRPELAGWSLTIACRPKGEADAAVRGALAAALAATIAAGRVELLGEVADMPALFARASLQLFVADHLRRKVDLPLAVLEGLALGLGLCALAVRPLAEIFERADERGLAVGIAVPPDASDDALVDAVIAGARGAAAGAWAAPAQALVSAEFSREAMVRGYESLHAALG